jgi:RimJ/RimL family protein N-acetyltransferase
VPTPTLHTNRLDLEPLRVDHAAEMVPVLGDHELYVFTGGNPPGEVDELAARYRAQIAGPGRDGETWHNWIIRLNDGQAVGFVQATVFGPVADVAWVVGVPWQRLGIGTEAAEAMCLWLVESGTVELVAHIHPENVPSGGVANALGFVATGELDAEGEILWRRRR